MAGFWILDTFFPERSCSFLKEMSSHEPNASATGVPLVSRTPWFSKLKALHNYSNVMARWTPPSINEQLGSTLESLRAWEKVEMSSMVMLRYVR